MSFYYEEIQGPITPSDINSLQKKWARNLIGKNYMREYIGQALNLIKKRIQDKESLKMTNVLFDIHDPEDINQIYLRIKVTGGWGSIFEHKYRILGPGSYLERYDAKAKFWKFLKKYGKLIVAVISTAIGVSANNPMLTNWGINNITKSLVKLAITNTVNSEKLPKIVLSEKKLVKVKVEEKTISYREEREKNWKKKREENWNRIKEEREKNWKRQKEEREENWIRKKEEREENWKRKKEEREENWKRKKEEREENWKRKKDEREIKFKRKINKY